MIFGLCSLLFIGNYCLVSVSFVNRIGTLLSPGDLLQHFLTVIFNKLDKGESLDDEFDLNMILQVCLLAKYSSLMMRLLHGIF